MEPPKYDIVVFGATGFTGQRVVQELVNTNYPGSIALAGRNLERLELVAAAAGVPNAPLITADVSDADSLTAMARAARVVINGVGPFRFYGEAVVAACIAAGTDYLDISGEPEFIERVELEYNAKAAAAGCYVASAVGFDSVPGDVGAWWTAQQFNELTPGARCTQIETFITIRGGPSGFRGHYPTYESAVHGFAASGELSALRRRAAAARGGRVAPAIPGPRLRVGPPKPTYDGRVGAWKVPFMGSDASVVKRTVAELDAAGEPPYACAVYMTLPSRLDAVLFSVFGAVFAFLARRGWGRALLLRFPRFFSFGMFTKTGPSAQQMAETTFEMRNFSAGRANDASMPLEAAPDLRLTTRVAGPEPGYVACSIFVVAAAVTLVQQRDRLSVAPGVHTPAALLRNTDYVKRLQQRGIVFEVLDGNVASS